MSQKLTSVATVLGTLMLSGHIASAADLPARAPAIAPAPIFTTVSGYIEADGGMTWKRNSYEYNSGSFSNWSRGRDRTWSMDGAGRANVWMSPNISIQTDIWGSGDSTKISGCDGCGSSTFTSFDLGAHLSYRDPNAFLVGAYGALGTFNKDGRKRSTGSSRTGVIGLEGQVYLGAATLYAQAGYASTISASDYDSADAWNVRGVARYHVNPNLRLSGELGYARISFDNNYRFNDAKAHQVHWGLGVEHKYGSSPFATFLKYEGANNKVSSLNTSDTTTSHAVKVGFRVYLNEGTLLANDRNGATLDIRDPISSFVRNSGVNYNNSGFNSPL